ncbi:MAG: hypothetical protein KKE44_08205 [Proteobacteria bacterium]|nr:hypothetical protein [Pseudomonadota bacterium]MBU1582710.1 hypothetical protein [Pseudomonadota bacterium]MBU2628183.1 hypothetical protein [Pseudomonadota bacterium]
MPDYYKPYVLYILLLAPLILPFVSSRTIHAYEGIQTYYIRYDVKSSNNTIINDNLLMVPAKNDFRAEKFSQISAAGVISAAPFESKTSVDKRIRDNFLKTILVKNGLKSIKTKDLDTIVSYEGAIITPLDIIKTTYREQLNNYGYEAQVEFSPVAFPDKWETLGMKHKIKEIVYDFFQFFK